MKILRFPRKVHITKTEFDQASGGDRFAVTMTEYPANLGAEPKVSEKGYGSYSGVNGRWCSKYCWDS